MLWFDTHKAVDDVLDKDNGLLTQVGDWIGGMNLTAEEVLEMNKVTVASVQTFVAATLSESTDRSKTRRSMAVGWMNLQVFLVLLYVSSLFLANEVSSRVIELILSGYNIAITSAITIFFYGSYGIARHNESKK